MFKIDIWNPKEVVCVHVHVRVRVGICLAEKTEKFTGFKTPKREMREF